MDRLLLLLLSFLAPSATISPEDPPRKYQVLSPKDDGIVVNGLNEAGDIVGFEWSEDEKSPGMINEVPFLARGQKRVVLPLLQGYTATFPADVSDTGLVVGRVSKPAAQGVRSHLRNQAFVWDEKGGIRGIGALEGDTASIACGVARGGDRISGFSLGDNRVRPCVWDRDGDSWKGVVLPHVARLGSQVVAISGDGKYVASVDGPIPCLWTRSGDGEWAREPIGGPGTLAPRAVNNSGMVVGLFAKRDGTTHAVVWTREGGLKTLEKPPGYDRSEALDVNNEGVVVGLIDGHHGSDVGPRGFLFEKGKLRLIDEGGPNFVGASAINDHGQVAGTMEKPEPEDAKPDQPGKPK